MGNRYINAVSYRTAFHYLVGYYKVFTKLTPFAYGLYTEIHIQAIDWSIMQPIAFNIVVNQYLIYML